MKTPRELLFCRHAPVKEKLNAIRERTVREAANVNRRSTPRRKSAGAALFFALTVPFRQLVWPARNIWTGLAAVWVALAIFNFTQADRHETATANTTVPAAEMRLAFQEQQRLLGEILRITPTAVPADPPRRNPLNQPRSQWRVTIPCV
jgi:hypothetical protein